MPGTGIHGYTGTSANGQYNIVNGIIQSSTPSTSATSINHNNSSSSSIAAAASQVANLTQQAIGSIQSQNLAASVAHAAGTDSSDYGEYIRQILAESQKNTAASQQFAREQMEYQTKSDQAAMAWSAQEAAKNRDWQESLADTAHQREVRDLLGAGLNPILSANNGAYTGSGATGQGFSSQGSMGQVDTNGTGALGGLFSTVMNTASNAMIAGIYTDAEKYSADNQLAAARLSAETSILNNQNTTSAQKEIAAAQINGEIERTGIQAAATRYSADKNLAAAGTSAAAMRYSADTNASATKYAADTTAAWQDYRTEQEHDTATQNRIANQYMNQQTNRSNWMKDPIGYGIQSAEALAIEGFGLYRGLYGDLMGGS